MKRVLLSLLTVVGIVAIAFGVQSARTSAQDAPVGEPVQAAIVQEVLALTKFITYQGRLLNPATNVAKQDGTYPMVFRLYNHPTNSGASLLWTESQNVVLQSGVFSVQLGSVVPFASTIFTGQDLWLGVVVGTDPELTPRTRISAVAYALFADNADRLDGINSTTFATDAEVLPLVKAGDGAGSTVDADLLDGFSSDSFARKVETGTAWYDFLAAGSSFDLHYQMGDYQGVVLWRIIPETVGAEFKITNLEDRLHQAGNYSFQLSIQNSGTVDSNFTLVYYILN